MTKPFLTLTLLTSLMFDFTAVTAPAALACGGVNEATHMCVAVPGAVSTFLLHEPVLQLLQKQKHVRHIGSTGTRVQVAVSDSRCVTGDVSGAGVTWASLIGYRWGVSTDFFVRIEDYPPLVKMLVSPLLSPAAALVRSQGGHISSLYQLSNGQPLIRINGTSSNAYSLVGVMGANGELTAIETRP